MLHFDLLKSIKLFIQYRDQAEVHPKNPYVFGIKGFHKYRFKYLRACDIMRNFANECGADHPERLRGTLLRKHIATNCHKLKLTEQEVSELANFMEHKENIHKQYYRLPQKEADILNISKYLEAALHTNGISQTGNNDDDDDSDDNDVSDDNNVSLDSAAAKYDSSTSTLDSNTIPGM